MKERIQKPARIIGGPCSVDEDNIHELYEIGDITLRGEPAVYGTRVVGLKSRTELNPTGDGMGIDYEAINNAIERNSFDITPSAKIAEAVHRATGLLIATEVMIPELQVPHYIGRIPKEKMLLWNPSVNGLGWQVRQMAQYARENEWYVGLKNPKALGDITIEEANNPDAEITSMEKVWRGLYTFAQANEGRIIYIQRGVDTLGKGKFRNAPIHGAAIRLRESFPDSKIYYDANHAYGPSLAEEIPNAIVEAMGMEHKGRAVYDGALIEVGTSKTDTKQHISQNDLREVVKEIASIRPLDIREYRSEHTFYQYTGKKVKEEAVAD